MDQHRTKDSLSDARRTLIERMQELNFGYFENLRIQQGEPLFDAESRIVKEIKLGGQNCPRPELLKSNFVLRQETIELFRQFDEIGTGRINQIHIRAGLPCRVVIRQGIFASRGRGTNGASLE